MATDFPISEATGGKGAQGELIASAWLIGLGYEVFRNVSYYGPADLIAWKPKTNETLLIDVKCVSLRTVYRRQDGTLGLPTGTKGHPLVHKLLVVSGRVVGFCRPRDKAAEFYWPLECEEIPAELEAGTYEEYSASRLKLRVVR